MTRYSVPLRDRIFVKGYGLFHLLKIKAKNDKNMSKDVGSK